MKKLVLFIGIILVCSFASAMGIEQYFSQIEGQKLPDAVASMFNGEKVNFCIVGAIPAEYQNTFSDRCYYSEIVDSKLTKLKVGAQQDATMRVESNFGTLEGIMNSQRPLRAFLDARNSGKIKIMGQNIVSSVKVFIGESFAVILGAFQ